MQLDATSKRRGKLEQELSEARAGLASATERATSVEASAATLKVSAEASRVRLEASEREQREHDRQAFQWKDERAALQGELHAERRHVELERQHKNALEASLVSERQLLKSIQVLLESRLGELATNTNGEDLAKGAEALQVLMGRAAVTQSTLEQREALLADCFELVTHRHADRLADVERASEQRDKCATALERLDEVLAHVAKLAVPAREGATIGALTADMGAVRQLLLAAGRTDGLTAGESLAAQEGLLRKSLSKFSEHNNQLQSELQMALEKLAALQAHAIPTAAESGPPPSKPAGRGPPAAHRPPPAQPREMSAETAAVLSKYDSAEYRASAPHTPHNKARKSQAAR